MDTNETFEQADAGHGLVLTPDAQGFLRESGKWAYFLGIVGFFLSAFILICAFFVGALLSLTSSFQPGATALPAAMGGLMSFVYILIAVFYFFFSFYLFQFGSKIKKGIVFGDAIEVSNALGKLKSFFKMWGIMTIVILALYALIFAIAIIVGISTSAMFHK